MDPDATANLQAALRAYVRAVDAAFDEPERYSEKDCIRLQSLQNDAADLLFNITFAEPAEADAFIEKAREARIADVR